MGSVPNYSLNKWGVSPIILIPIILMGSVPNYSSEAYFLHKLIISQKRPRPKEPKRLKDLDQCAVLMDVLNDSCQIVD